jgi:hypothetical protein
MKEGLPIVTPNGIVHGERIFIFIYSKSITYTNSLTCSCSYTPLTGTNSWYILLLWCSKYSACVCIYKKQTIARIKMSFIIKFSK